jgi:hypothetical protein
LHLQIVLRIYTLFAYAHRQGARLFAHKNPLTAGPRR